MKKPQSQRAAFPRSGIAPEQPEGYGHRREGGRFIMAHWGRKSILTLIALLASIGLAYYLKWSPGGVTLVFGTILGMHHTANVAQAKL